VVALLYNIRSLHNVGSIFRTADAVGLKKLYLCGITPTPVDRLGKPRQQLTKVSLGAEKYIPWQKEKSVVKVIKKLKEKKYKIYAIEQSKNAVLYNRIRTKKNDKIALIVGNEIKGLPNSVLKHADKILQIPMRGKKESLNVAVAFGIVVYHVQIS